MHSIKIYKSITRRDRVVSAYLREINNYPLLSADEETELASLCAMGDRKAREKLINCNLRFVVSVAKQYEGKNTELSDLINMGNIGLITAVERFDNTRGFKFISYAVWWIRQSILEGMKESSMTIRLPSNKENIVSKATKAAFAFQQQNMREPTTQELAELINMDESKLKAALLTNPRCLSLDCPIPGEENGDINLYEFTPDTTIGSTDERAEKDSLKKHLDMAMQVLSEKEREVVLYFFGFTSREMTMDEIAGKLGISTERVRQIKKNAIKKLQDSDQARALLKCYV